MGASEKIEQMELRNCAYAPTANAVERQTQKIVASQKTEAPQEFSHGQIQQTQKAAAQPVGSVSHSLTPTKGNFTVTYQQTVAVVYGVPVAVIVRVQVSSSGTTIVTNYRVGVGVGGGASLPPAGSIAVTGTRSVGTSSGLGLTATGSFATPIRQLGAVGTATVSTGGKSAAGGFGYGLGAGASVALTYDWSTSGEH